MKIQDFQKSDSGRVLKAREGYWAYIPNPLPPKLRWTDELVETLTRAHTSVGRLAGVGQTLVNPHLLINPFKSREAVLSSRIEGTQASLSDLFLFEAAPSPEPRVGDVRQVRNYVRALEHGLQRVSELPLSLRLIRELHAVLLEGVRGEYYTPGEFRRSQNWIGPAGCTLNEASFVPPPAIELSVCLGEFESYIRAPSRLPPLVRSALIHYQFEAIHPFLDGNGRIGRLLITLLLCIEGLLPQPLLYLSAYFEANRQAYYDHLLRVSQAGRWTEWVLFFLTGVHEQAQDAIARSNRLIALHEEFRARCHRPRGSALLLKLVDRLFELPAIRASAAQELLGVTFRSAQNNIEKLVKLGILREVTGQRRNRLYLADTIVEAIERPNPKQRDPIRNAIHSKGL